MDPVQTWSGPTKIGVHFGGVGGRVVGGGGGDPGPPPAPAGRGGGSGAPEALQGAARGAVSHGDAHIAQGYLVDSRPGRGGMARILVYAYTYHVFGCSRSVSRTRTLP